MNPYRSGPTGIPNVLVCSALDPTGGTGFIADTRVIAMIGARPVGAITALSVQDTKQLRACHEADAALFGAELNVLLADLPIAAVKIGLLNAEDVVRELADRLGAIDAPVVWDPVTAPSHGDMAFERELFDTVLAELGPHLALITTTPDQLALLVNEDLMTRAEVVRAARGLAMDSPFAVLVTDLEGDDAAAATVLFHGDEMARLTGARTGGDSLRGVGCALSSAIAAHLALGRDLDEACRRAHDFVIQHSAAPVLPGRGAPSVV